MSTKPTYTITEKQTVNSTRNGVRIDLANLNCAKLFAKETQFFQGTVMTIEDHAGGLLAYLSRGKWINV